MYSAHMYTGVTHFFPDTSVPQGSEFEDIGYPIGMSRPYPRLYSLPDGSVVSKAVKRSTLQQVEENLKRFPHCLLLTRVGQFYEVLQS